MTCARVSRRKQLFREVTEGMLRGDGSMEKKAEDSDMRDCRFGAGLQKYVGNELTSTGRAKAVKISMAFSMAYNRDGEG